MTLSEWIELQALIAGFWPHSREATRDQLRLQHQLLVSVDRGAAERVITAEAASGAEWPPPPGRIAKLCLQPGGDLPALAPGVPTFDEAYHVIYETRGLLTGDEKAWTGVHPLIRSFAVREGLERLRVLPVECPDYGQLHRRDLRLAWDRHVEAMEGREAQVVGLPPGDRPGALRRLDPLAAIGIDEPRELTEEAGA